MEVEQKPNSNDQTTTTDEQAPKLPMGTQSTKEKQAAAQTGADNKDQGTAPSGTETTTPGKPGGDQGANGEGEDDKDVDYKNKFSESSKEAQRLLDLLKAAGLDAKTGQPITNTEPDKPAEATETSQTTRADLPAEEKVPLTEEELKVAIPGWANLPEETKILMRDTKAAYKKITLLTEALAEIQDERTYNKEFKALSKKEEWKKLAEFAEEFRDFAYQDKNLKTPMETLAAAFLHNKGLGTKPPEEKPPSEGVERGSGGNKQKEDNGQQKDGFTADELATIRTTDPKRYAELAKKGKIKIRDK